MTITIKNFASTYQKETGFDNKKYSEVTKLFLYKLSEKLIKDNYKVILPFGLGNVYISESKSSRDNYDFGYYKKTGKLIKFNNLHTMGKSFFFKWSTKGLYSRNIKYYSFRAIPDKTKRRIGSRGLTAWIQELNKKNIDYITYSE